MKVAIYQPRYFPQLHYFNRALSSDIFVLLDSAQYTKGLTHNLGRKRERNKSYQSDTVIKFPTGVHFLTVPIKHSGLLPIDKSNIDYSTDWARIHKATIGSAYGKSPELSSIFPQIEKLLTYKYKSLAELNVKSFLWGISFFLGLKLDPKEINLDIINAHLQKSPFKLKRIVLGSELQAQRPNGRQMGTQWTVGICKELGATEYLHGGTAQAGYMDESYYDKNKIKLITQDWKCHKYPQQFDEKVGFIPNLSIIDLLLNVDQKKAIEIIK